MVPSQDTETLSDKTWMWQSQYDTRTTRAWKDIPFQNYDGREAHMDGWRDPLQLKHIDWQDRQLCLYQMGEHYARTWGWKVAAWQQSYKKWDTLHYTWTQKSPILRELWSGRKHCVITSLPAICRSYNANPRAYLNDIIARIPYMEKASEEKLVEMHPHRWILSHPKAVITDICNMAKS